MPQQYSFLTADDILTPALSEAINNSTSQLTAIQDTQMVAFVQWLNNQFLMLSHTWCDMGYLSYMKKNKPFKTYSNTTLNGAVLSGAATFTLVSSTDFPASGRCVIESTKGALEFVDFSANAANILTVDTATDKLSIQMAHSSGERVTQLYPVASDMAKVIALKVNSYPPFAESTSDGFPVFGEYAQYDGYFWLPRNLPASDVTVWYEKTGKTITTRTGTTAVTNIPSMAIRWAIEMTLFHLFRIRRKREDLNTTDGLAKEYLQTFFMYDAEQQTGSQMRYQ